MTKRILIAIPLLVASMAFGQSEQKAIGKMFADQTAAANRGDVVAYMATVDPASASYKQTKDAMTQIFKTYKLKFTAENFSIVSVKGTTAQIKTTMVTTKISGPEFRNNRLKMTTTLIKKGGKWLMTASKISGVEYLD